MDRPLRSLRDELMHTPGAQRTVDLGCALENKSSCCDGIGFRLQARGSLTHASLCSCVQECQSCFGQNRRLINGQSKVCRTPAPSRVVNLINNACIPARYCGAKLDSFSNFSGNGREVVQRVWQWMRDFDLNKPRGMILGGPVGVGKTYLLAAIAKNFASRGISVRFVDFFQLLLELKSGYANDKNDAGLLGELIEVDILLVDELGKGRNSDWEASILDQLVMGRYNRNKILVASTNYDLKPSDRVNHLGNTSLDEKKPGSFDLDRFESLEQRVGSRIYSRLFETSDFLELNGEDFRKRSLAEKLQNLRPSPAPRRTL